jgi:hypothetical protein
LLLRGLERPSKEGVAPLEIWDKLLPSPAKSGKVQKDSAASGGPKKKPRKMTLEVMAPTGMGR